MRVRNLIVDLELIRDQEARVFMSPEGSGILIVNQDGTSEVIEIPEQE